jgi:hypothetical protein
VSIIKVGQRDHPSQPSSGSASLTGFIRES